MSNKPESKTIEEQLFPGRKPANVKKGKVTYRNMEFSERYKTETDGVDHINISLQGKTHLGRLLALEAEEKFVHPILGHFRSVTNYWAYIKSKSRHTSLRNAKPLSCFNILKYNNSGWHKEII